MVRIDLWKSTKGKNRWSDAFTKTLGQNMVVISKTLSKLSITAELHIFGT